jgi:two-component system nitrogen regulation response regulator NtrX
MPSVLIVDDEPNIRRMVGALLAGEGYDVRDAADGATGLALAETIEPDVALVDLMMPGDLDGLGLLARLRERRPDLPVVMMSGRAALTDAVRATKLGAFTFLEKPLTPEGVLLALASAFELRQARRAAQALREDLGISGEMIGDSPVMRDVRALIARVGPSDARVLITGESGTGKELVAAALHLASPRRDRPFVRVNCAAIPRDLVESEMFGHERGAFTGATDRRVGRFELAHTGTLFLDEVGDLGAEAQAKLLRAIEAREIERVGGGKPIKIDLRILAATNKDLTRAVADGSFREDLFFRLNVIPISLPPLRDRPGDLPALVRHFADRHRTRTGRPLVRWREGALAALSAYRWPGNVRELANVVERLAILHAGSEIGEAQVREVLPSLQTAAAPASGTNGDDVPGSSLAALAGLPLSDALDVYERRLISAALAQSDGNVAEAARRLQTDRPNLYRRMRRLGLASSGE